MVLELEAGFFKLREHAVVIGWFLKTMDLALSLLVLVAGVGPPVDETLHPQYHFISVEKREKMKGNEFVEFSAGDRVDKLRFLENRNLLTLLSAN